MNVYEYEFEDLACDEEIASSKSNNLLSSSVDVSVVIATLNKDIKDIINMKSGDVIMLNKNIDEKLDLCINKTKIAECESVVFNNKMGVRIVKA